MTYDPCAGIKPFSDEDVIKGEPRIIAQNQGVAGISRDRINCDQYNAIHFDVIVSGGSSAVDLTVEGCYAEGGVYTTIADPQGTRSVTVSESFDVVVGTVWAQVRLGAIPAGQNYTVWATPYVAGGMPTVNATIVVDTLSAIQVNTGALNLSGFLTIGTDGGIYQGTGSGASPTTGLRMWNDGGIGRIAGYNAGTIQWYADTDGRLYAGAGNVMLDANGLTLAIDAPASQQIRWGTGPAPGAYIQRTVDLGVSFLDIITDGYLALRAATSRSVSMGVGAGDTIVVDGTGLKVALNVGFYNTEPQSKQTVSGAKGGNAALGSLLTALATIGLITDSSGA